MGLSTDLKFQSEVSVRNIEPRTRHILLVRTVSTPRTLLNKCHLSARGTEILAGADFYGFDQSGCRIHYTVTVGRRHRERSRSIPDVGTNTGIEGRFLQSEIGWPVV